MTAIKGLLGKKIGMTQIFKENRVIPVTVVSAGPCYVMAIKKKDTDGYDAIKLGYGKVKPKKRTLTKPRLGEFNKLKIEPLKEMREIRIEDSSALDLYKVGEELKINIFKQGEFLDVTSRSKGKGFQGGVKRWGWSIGPKSHGSRSHRAIGSIGQSSDPSRVFRGLHMAGHMGDDKVTVQNIEIIDLDFENNLILLKGGIPGARNSMVILKSAKKKNAELFKPEEQEEAKEEVVEDVKVSTEEKVEKEEDAIDNNKKEEADRIEVIKSEPEDLKKDNEED